MHWPVNVNRNAYLASHKREIKRVPNRTDIRANVLKDRSKFFKDLTLSFYGYNSFCPGMLARTLQVSG